MPPDTLPDSVWNLQCSELTCFSSHKLFPPGLPHFVGAPWLLDAPYSFSCLLMLHPVTLLSYLDCLTGLWSSPAPSPSPLGSLYILALSKLLGCCLSCFSFWVFGLNLVVPEGGWGLNWGWQAISPVPACPSFTAIFLIIQTAGLQFSYFPN